MLSSVVVKATTKLTTVRDAIFSSNVRKQRDGIDGKNIDGDSRIITGISTITMLLAVAPPCITLMLLRVTVIAIVLNIMVQQAIVLTFMVLWLLVTVHVRASMGFCLCVCVFV